jgi:excisionase family DNA binding protein
VKRITAWGDLPLTLTPTQAGQVFQPPVSRTTIWRWARDGKIPSTRLGRNLMIPRDGLRALIDGTATSNAPVAGDVAVNSTPPARKDVAHG